eukprot:CAMPEP_0184193082 /NCGR_PEP_ID=MMETSP0976-20121227/3804_1 /TAXON_ID=483370 /ORGANISM="non described non described, Strain CCMP2097" /LENGTH=298 /DNA_ID=CAMNT_0026497491 /DNA_START=23 /DNA_END=917 /DNA_ORIENTATION=+
MSVWHPVVAAVDVGGADEGARDATDLLVAAEQAAAHGRHRDRRRVEGHGGLREDAAVERGARLEDGLGRDEEDALQVGSGASGYEARDLEEDVLGQRAADEEELFARGDGDVARNLQDENGVGFAGEVDVVSDVDVAAPRVHARRQRSRHATKDAADDACTEVDARRDLVGAPGRVGVGGLHVGNGGRHFHRGRGVVVGGEHGARDLARRGHFARRVLDLGEARHGGAGDGRDADVARDSRRRHRGDARLCQDDEVTRSAKDDLGLQGRGAERERQGHEETALEHGHRCLFVVFVTIV